MAIILIFLDKFVYHVMYIINCTSTVIAIVCEYSSLITINAKQVDN